MVDTPNQPGANAGTITQASQTADIKAGWDTAFGLSGQSSLMSATDIAAVAAAGATEGPEAALAGSNQPTAADIKSAWGEVMNTAISDLSDRLR